MYGHSNRNRNATIAIGESPTTKQCRLWDITLHYFAINHLLFRYMLQLPKNHDIYLVEVIDQQYSVKNYQQLYGKSSGSLLLQQFSLWLFVQISVRYKIPLSLLKKSLSRKIVQNCQFPLIYNFYKSGYAVCSTKIGYHHEIFSFSQLFRSDKLTSQNLINSICWQFIG